MHTFSLVNKDIIATDVAKYFLYRSSQDGDLVSPLKMQKLVYYAYVWTLVKNKKKLFSESIEAWPNGPVSPSLYRDLKQFGSMPISNSFIGASSQSDIDRLMSKFPVDVMHTLENVYDEYMTKTAFELVVLTHSEKPWIEARRGLQTTEPSNVAISDDQIVAQYGQA